MVTLKLNTKNNRRDRELSKAVRAAAEIKKTSIPIMVVDGFDPPIIEVSEWVRSADGLLDPDKVCIRVGAGWICQNGLV